MVRTRGKPSEMQVEEDAAVARAAEESDSDDELLVAEKAQRGRYAQTLNTLFDALLDAVDASPLPYFKEQVRRRTEAFQEFLQTMYEIFRREEDSDAEVDDDEEAEVGEEDSESDDAEYASYDEDEEEEEMEEEETSVEDEELNLSDDTEQEAEESLPEEEREYDDDEPVVYIDEQTEEQ